MNRSRSVYLLSTFLVLCSCKPAEDNSVDVPPLIRENPSNESTESLREAADKLINSGDDIALRGGVMTLFALVDRLMEQGEKEQARYYLEQGTTAHPWAFDYQLLYAEMLNANSDKKHLREIVDLVLEHAEKDDQINRARKLVEQPPLSKIETFREIEDTDKKIILVPIGNVEVCIVEELRKALEESLAIPVLAYDLKVDVPGPTRDPYSLLVAQLRERIITATKQDSELQKEVWRSGISDEDINHDDKFIEFLRHAIYVNVGRESLAAFDSNLFRAQDRPKQWEESVLTSSLARAVSPIISQNRMFIGITDLDSYQGESNYIFSIASTTRRQGIIMYPRFRGVFSDGFPNRKKLVERCRKCAITVYMSMLGIERCTIPTCVHSFANSVQELDAQSLCPCATCQTKINEARNLKNDDSEETANDLYAVAYNLLEKGDNENAILAFKEIVTQFGEEENGAIQQLVGRALIGEGDAMKKLNRYEEAMGIFNELVARYGDSGEPALKKIVADALDNVAYILGRLQRSQEEIGIYENIFERYGNENEPEVMACAAKALYNKAVALQRQNKYEEAVEVLAKVVELYGNTKNESVGEWVARSLFYRGIGLGKLKQFEAALLSFEQVVSRFGNAEKEEIRELVAHALVYKVNVFKDINKMELAGGVYDEMITRFGDTENPTIRKWINTLRVDSGR